MAAGRPSSFKQETADRICSELSQGISLRTVCKAKSLPSMVTVFAWFRKYPEFLNQYVRAKEESADALVEDMLDIADNQVSQPALVDGKPVMVDGKPVMMVDNAAVAHARLRVDTRKWSASKLKPKKYGDHKTLELGNKDGKPLKIEPWVVEFKNADKLLENDSEEK